MDSKSTELLYGDGLHRLTRLALILLAVIFGGGTFWAATAGVEGAVISPGQVTVESSAKTIEHSDGGYVASIHVSEGDAVEEGQLLLQLDPTRAATELAVATDTLNELVATEARLIAESLGEISFSISERNMAFVELNDDFNATVTAQQVLLEARQTSVAGQHKQLSEQILQFEKEIVGLEAQVAASDEELDLITDELAGLERLLRRRLVAKARVNEMRREKSRMQGQRGELISEIARSRLAISEREVQKIRVVDDARTQTLQQLQQVRVEKARAVQEKIAAENRLSRLDVRTSRAGIVHDLQVHTIDGVIQPGDVLMSIIPREDALIVEARISPGDIDQIRQGQDARLIFSSFNMRTTPQLNGKVSRVSPDVSIDPVTGANFYTARLTLLDGERDRIGDNEIVPGMPVETFITTQKRTVAAYLLQPMTDHLRRAFREE